MTRFAVTPGCWLLLSLFLWPTTGTAQSAGDNIFQFGLLHIRPQESNEAPRNQLRSNPAFPALGIQDEFRSESVDLRAPNIETLGLIYKRYLTDHIVLSFTGGIPRKSGIRSRGVVGPTGPTRQFNNLDTGEARFNPAASARQWSPILLLEYHFGAPDSTIRPFVAAGASYVFFTEVELDDDLETAVNQQFGAPLALAAGRPGDTRTNLDIEDTFAAVFSAGLGLRLSPRWTLTASASYLPLETVSTVTIDAEDGTRLVTSRTRLSFNPVVLGLLLGFSF